MLDKISALVLAIVALAPAACAQRSGDAAARRVISTWTDSESMSASEVARLRALAQRDCNQGQGIDGATYGRCSLVMLRLAEEELAAAEREYEARIDEASEYTNETDRRAVWRYAQRRWRELRDADCVELGLGAGGGSGIGASVTRCMAEETRERTAQLRRM